MEIRENVLLAPLTTFEIGGAARYFVEVTNEEQIREAVDWANANGKQFVVLAGGSNVLVHDAGVDGLVIHIVEGAHALDLDTLTADPGCNLLNLIRETGKSGFGGWEKMAGIPGSIGGAARGNAGAFGTEIKDVATKVRALNTETGVVRDFAVHDCDFSYRHSYFKDHSQWIVTRVTLKLQRVAPEISAQIVEQTIAERERRHLQNVKAAGSFFMNPIAPPEIVAMFELEKDTVSREGRVPAGWLIEKSGQKGKQVGGAIASLQHPNYIVNTGNATAYDVMTLANRIKQEVQEKFGILMREEAALL